MALFVIFMLLWVPISIAIGAYNPRDPYSVDTMSTDEDQYAQCVYMLNKAGHKNNRCKCDKWHHHYSEAKQKKSNSCKVTNGSDNGSKVNPK